ncbi:MAG: F0F1 ATP synthase subunit gamma [Lentisphaerae bacterium]|nr:F0F1 ATP synthase subunit gamma [Lentisphaerota bacterium]
MQLSELRKELSFNTELVQLIETLKNIAAAQYHVMEKEKERFDRFMDAFSEFFRVVNLVEVDDPLVHVISDVLGVVVVTSDSGFMGGLNQGVIRRAQAEAERHGPDKVSYIVVGDKGCGTFSDNGVDFAGFGGINQDTIYEQAMAVKEHIVKEVLERRIGKVIIVYPRPLSFSAQTIETINLLPCGELFDKEAESEVTEHVGHRGFVADARKIIVESSLSDMLEYLSGVWVTSKLFEVFEDSKLAEFSARAMHLEGSGQKLEKDRKKIEHQCFKAAHELIDKGMRESFASRGKKKRRKPAA